jgi:hypothetical protein
VVVLVACYLVGNAGPAAAHGVGGPSPTNYVTEVRRVVPAVRGISVRAVSLGTRLELTNRTSREVVVPGYEGEPYLRVGPGGVYRNERSPAVFLNRSLTPTAEPPRVYSAKAAPRWKRISSGQTTSWHDHRTHWMANGDPPGVARDPGRAQIVQHFDLPLRYGDTTLRVVGIVRWVPGPSPWPWIAAAAVLLAATIVLGRTRRWAGALSVGLAILVVTEVVHVVGSWDGSGTSFFARLFAALWSILGVALAGVALVWLRRRDPWSAVPAVLVAALFLAIAGGLADVTSLSRSQIPTSLPLDLARATVTAAMGIGFGLVVAAGLHLRMPRGLAPTGRPARPPVEVAR